MKPNLIVVYSDKGEAIPDPKAAEWTDSIIDKIDNALDNVTDITIAVGTMVMIDSIRLAILQERLDYQKVYFQFKEEKWQANKHAKLEKWPVGFCDTHDIILTHLLGWEDNLPLTTH